MRLMFALFSLLVLSSPPASAQDWRYTVWVGNNSSVTITVADNGRDVCTLQPEDECSFPTAKNRLGTPSLMEWSGAATDVQANIEYLYIRSYGQTASVTSNLWVYSRT